MHNNQALNEFMAQTWLETRLHVRVADSGNACVNAKNAVHVTITQKRAAACWH